MAVAEDAGTPAEVGFLVLVDHFGEAAGCDDAAGRGSLVLGFDGVTNEIC